MRVLLLIVAMAAAAGPLHAQNEEDAIAGAAVAAPKADQVTAGHLLRRIGFGPTLSELKVVERVGVTTYVNQQLNPAGINDSAAAAKLPRPPKNIYDSPAWQARWYARMVYSRRQLLEKMTLTWHEHFATSAEKVQVGFLMHAQEDLLRRYALGHFADMLKAIIKDQAMLIWLDNDYNNGNARDDDGNPVLPNRNFARELLQLFTVGPVQLAMDGSPLLDTGGNPLPNYTEQDVTGVARALTGWHVDYKHHFKAPVFEAGLHDAGDKTVLGVLIKGRPRTTGALEVNDVVAILMAQPSMAPFVSKLLIQKLATETPTPEYVSRVSTVFQKTKGDVRQTVKAILLDPEFTSDAVVRTQYRTPIEHFVGMVRALGGTTRGDALTYWTYFTHHMVYYPPSVFSFYPPGRKATLVNSANLTYRDRFSDDFVAWNSDTGFDAGKLIRVNHLTTPDLIVDFLGNALLAAPISSDVRAELMTYMEGRADQEKLRGAAWLLICSPDFQRN